MVKAKKTRTRTVSAVSEPGRCTKTKGFQYLTSKFPKQSEQGAYFGEQGIQRARIAENRELAVLRGGTFPALISLKYI
jgi:hypothetical protein